VTATSVHAALGTLEVIAVTGDSAPNGSTTFANASNFSLPSINNAGQAVFIAYSEDGSPTAIYRHDPSSQRNPANLTKIAQAGDILFGGEDSFTRFATHPAINESGQVAFRASIDSSTSGRGIFRSDGPDNLVQIVRSGDPAPNGNGSFYTLGENSDLITLNDAGNVAFRAALMDSNGQVEYSSLFQFTDQDGLFTIIRSGEATPDGN